MKRTRVLLPLRYVNIKSEIRGATVKTVMELNYHNPSREVALRDSTFTFPLDGPILTKFEAIIDDTAIITQVRRGENDAEDE